MKAQSKTTAIIVAAGKGKRMEKNINKQYILLRDKPVIAYTLEVFERVELIDEVILVVGEGEIGYCQKEIINRYKIKKVSAVIAGGKERKDSVNRGLSAVKPDCKIVVVHDGARPFITEDIIEASIKEAERWGAAAAAVPVKDTVKRVNRNMEVMGTLIREELWAVQTPQTFHFILLKEAYGQEIADLWNITDDAMLVERLGHKVKIFKGAYENIKITTPEDLDIAEGILKRRGLKCVSE
jgi:2-C-methyl-D-erythritol 4-phosphate cytidylyltransferase